MKSELVIEQTKKWISDVVIGCNFCPFAAHVVKQQTIFFKVETATAANICLESFLQEITRLDNDAANYTNRSVYPMLHLLRESSIDKALEHFNDPESIPDRNINFAREKGIVYMKMLREACL